MDYCWITLQRTTQSAIPTFLSLCEQARTRNDPSFASITGSWCGAKTEKSYITSDQVRTSVVVKKTDVSAESNDSGSTTTTQPDDNPDKQCPLHNKPHPLRKCRGFRNKTLDERKTYLKEKNICFRCCASSAHIAKACDKPVQCKECNSDRHLSAMHPGPAPWKADVQQVSTDHGGELPHQ